MLRHLYIKYTINNDMKLQCSVAWKQHFLTAMWPLVLPPPFCFLCHEMPEEETLSVEVVRPVKAVGRGKL